MGFYKKATGRQTITYHEALDEALSVGWIDGVRRSLDADSYVQRFTPRQPKSYWSAVNVARARALVASGRMKAAGLAAFERRDRARTRAYSVEQKNPRLDGELDGRFKANPEAWRFFQAQPPGYRRMATWFVVSARRDETRRRRLDLLIDLSARGRRLEPMAPASSK